MQRAPFMRVRALQLPAQDPSFEIGPGSQHIPNQHPEDSLDVCGQGF